MINRENYRSHTSLEHERIFICIVSSYAYINDTSRDIDTITTRKYKKYLRR